MLKERELKPKFGLRTAVKPEKQPPNGELEIKKEDEPSIFNEHREYFEEFLRKTDQKENSNKFLIENYPTKKKLKILSVGAGSGEDILGFLGHLKSRGADFQFYYLDPSKLLFNKFEKNADKFELTKHISGVELKKFEQFETKEKFDLINASHVFYYIEDWEKSLKKISGSLNKDGKAFIMLQSEDSDNFKLRKNFLEKEHYGEELIKVIRGLNLNYDIEKIVSTLDVTDTVSENNKLSLAGKRLISFLLRTNYDNLDENTKHKICDYILQNSKIRNKQRVFELVDNYITIKK